MEAGDYKLVQFKELEIGQEFECYGDTFINYSSPIICKCIKDSEDLAHEINGVSFYVNQFDTVFLTINPTIK